MFNNWCTIYVVDEFAKDLDEAITAKGKKSPKMISGVISESEARTHVFQESKRKDRVLQNAKTTKSVKFYHGTSNEVMAAKAGMRRVYVQATYESTNSYKYFKITIPHKLHVFSLPGGKWLILSVLIPIISYISTND